VSERNERNERDERSAERRGAEGVRIIGPEEAQAAIDAGAAAGRRRDDELRYGDVPPAPSGPRLPHRFPLPDSVDPAEAVPRPPVVSPARVDSTVTRPRHVTADDAHDPRPWHERGPAPAGAGAGDSGQAGVPTGIHAVVPSSGPGSSASAPVDADDTVDLGIFGGDTGLPAGAVVPPVRDPSAVDQPADPDATNARPELTASEQAASEQVAFEPPVHEPPVYELAAQEPPAYQPPANQPPEYQPTAQESPPYQPPAPQPATAALHSADPDITAAFGVPAAAGDDSPAPAWPQSDDAALHLAPFDEGITVSGGYETELPHWTDPPTGEVPRILADRAAPAGSDRDEDLAAWEALGSRSATWRDDSTGWHEPDDLGDLADDDLRVGALDTSRTEHSDLYSFDEDFERLEEERSGQHRPVTAEDLDMDEDWSIDEAEPAPRVTRVSSRQPRSVRTDRSGRQTRAPRGARPLRAPRREGERSGRGSEVGSRIGAGAGLVVVLIICYAIGPVGLLMLATVVVTAAAAEVYDMLRPSGFRPATLLGLLATVGVMFAAYWRGPGALALVTVLVFVASMLWYLWKVVDARPLANVAVTVSAFVWVGVLGSYAALLLRSHGGKGLFLGAVLPAVAADIVAYFVGRRIGNRPMAPSVSPGKTWEGAVGGGLAAVVVALIVAESLSPWGGLSHGLALGVVVAVVAPIGDLFESMVKRDLSVKNSGSMLSGHGGVLDRFDSVLLVLPAVYYLASLWGYVK
jgi:phosphatidate cytidylyltransferase